MNQLTALVGVNGAGLSNGLYLPEGAVSVQLVPFGADVNWKEFGDLLKIRGPYLEWFNKHEANSFVRGHNSNTDTIVDLKEWRGLVEEILNTPLNKQLLEHNPQFRTTPPTMDHVLGVAPVGEAQKNNNDNSPAPQNVNEINSNAENNNNNVVADLQVQRSRVSPSVPNSVNPDTKTPPPPPETVRLQYFTSEGRPHTRIPYSKPVVHVFVPHFNRTGFLIDMLVRLTETRDDNFLVHLMDFVSPELVTDLGVQKMLEASKILSRERELGYPLVDFVRLNQRFSKGYGLHLAYKRVFDRKFRSFFFCAIVLLISFLLFSGRYCDCA
jgi:hypothetical protein